MQKQNDFFNDVWMYVEGSARFYDINGALLFFISFQVKGMCFGDYLRIDFLFTLYLGRFFNNKKKTTRFDGFITLFDRLSCILGQNHVW